MPNSTPPKSKVSIVRPSATVANATLPAMRPNACQAIAVNSSP